MAVQLNPYLHVSGNAREAMEFYRSVFGGELEVMTFGDLGGGGGQYPDDGVMHAQLRTEHGLVIMASDGLDPSASGAGTVSLSLSGDESETMTRWFEALAGGGKVEVPLDQQVWGDVFGQVTDRFGMRWLVNIASAPA